MVGIRILCWNCLFFAASSAFAGNWTALSQVSEIRGNGPISCIGEFVKKFATGTVVLSSLSNETGGTEVFFDRSVQRNNPTISDLMHPSFEDRKLTVWRGYFLQEAGVRQTYHAEPIAEIVVGALVEVEEEYITYLSDGMFHKLAIDDICTDESSQCIGPFRDTPTSLAHLGMINSLIDSKFTGRFMLGYFVTADFLQHRNS